jgi:hypothetical protein
MLEFTISAKLVADLRRWGVVRRGYPHSHFSGQTRQRIMNQARWRVCVSLSLVLQRGINFSPIPLLYLNITSKNLTNREKTTKNS